MQNHELVHELSGHPPAKQVRVVVVNAAGTAVVTAGASSTVYFDAETDDVVITAQEGS